MFHCEGWVKEDFISVFYHCAFVLFFPAVGQCEAIFWWAGEGVKFVFQVPGYVSCDGGALVWVYTAFLAVFLAVIAVTVGSWSV